MATPSKTEKGTDEERRSSPRDFIERFDAYLSHRPNHIAILELLPASTLVIGLFGGSLAIIILFSFLEETPPQGALHFTLEHYEYVLSQSLYLEVIFDSLFMALIATTATLILSFPPAYYLAVVRRKRQTFYLILLVLPFWINIVVRTLAWRQILNSNGLFSWIFVDILRMTDSLNLMFTQTAVIIGLIHVFLPFMIIPVYTTLAKVDKSHIEAAKNLGANKIQAFYEVTLPQALPGIAAGVVLVFILAAGAYVTPLLLGGQKASMIANIIGSIFTLVRAWGDGSALAMIYTLAVVVLLYFFNRFVGLDELYGGA